jgi:hypothetical protein
MATAPSAAVQNEATPAAPSSSAPQQQQQQLELSIACRNLSSSSSVVALFEAVDLDPSTSTKQLNYLCHTEGIRNAHHPDFQTPLLVDLTSEARQRKIKFNVYSLPAGSTKVEEHQRLGSAYVMLGDIVDHVGEELMVDLIHGQNREKDRNNQWLKSHMIIRARIVDKKTRGDRDVSPGAEAELAKAALESMTAGAALTLFPSNSTDAPKQVYAFFRPDSELGALYWVPLEQCERIDEKKEESKDESKADENAKYSLPKSFNATKVLALATTAASSQAPVDAQSTPLPPVVRLMDILAIYEGQQTAAFQLSGAATGSSLPTPDKCFSIITEQGSIDFAAPSTHVREQFLQGIHGILTAQIAREKAKENKLRFLVKVSFSTHIDETNSTELQSRCSFLTDAMVYLSRCAICLIDFVMAVSLSLCPAEIRRVCRMRL